MNSQTLQHFLPDPPPIIPKFTYPQLERITQANGVRHYVSPNGSLLPSITTIIAATSDKTQLTEWRERVGDKKADKARDDGAALGTLVHEHMECFLQGKERPRGNNLIRQMASRMSDEIIKYGFPQVDEVWGYEKTLYLEGVAAGTTDLVGVFQNKPSIMDYKNAKKMRTAEMIEDYFVQTCGYATCHNEMFGTKIKQGVIFMVARDLTYQTFVIEGKEFEHHSEQFLLRAERYLFDA